MRPVPDKLQILFESVSQPGARADILFAKRHGAVQQDGHVPLEIVPVLQVAVETVQPVAVAFAGAARAGFYGIQGLSVLERALIFPALGILLWLAAAASVGEMVPGSRRRTAPGFLLGAGSLALLAVFAVLFHNYRTDRFVSQGVVCLIAGLLHTIPAALASWLLLRRGFAVNSVAAGLAAGTVAGLAGVTMLELHCANFQALHVMLWHTAVMPLSGAAGALLAWAARFRAGSA